MTNPGRKQFAGFGFTEKKQNKTKNPVKARIIQKNIFCIAKLIFVQQDFPTFPLFLDFAKAQNKLTFAKVHDDYLKIKILQ